MEKIQARNMSPIVLAYMGDTVYESFVREYLINKNNICKVNDLHKRAVKFVKASAQAKAVLSLQEELSDDEGYIVKRGRNQKSNSVPKNADATDYRYATGFEALVGYLHLIKEKDRVNYIMSKAVEIIESEI
ncbi:MAG: Mini-ribonuclease 3 [Tepidibacter sp.]|jgi:ribonuclease-3 family protein|uniref:Mini-ribonuclease 3 n=1 Tax=Tepidibacter sp. TaxID=2529387 RepID=UPI0025EF515D|nr:ribonuclease III domain-containing protein [Tepidibacter sp.]MCT4508912.1 Mini-ribonuclease 3 [Tepidibacter sp.]